MFKNGKKYPNVLFDQEVGPDARFCNIIFVLVTACHSSDLIYAKPYQ